LKAAEVMARCIDDSRLSIKAVKKILYPDISQLVFFPGPKKARRLVREWLAARQVIDGLFGNKESGRKTTSKS